MDVERLADHVHDPTKGLYTAIQVQGGRAVALGAHVERLSASCRTVYGSEPPAGLEREIVDAAAAAGSTDFLKTEIVPMPDGGMIVRVTANARPLPPSGLVATPVVVPNWNGQHKWLDRPELVNPRGTLFVDQDLNVLEMDHATVYAVFDNTLVTPALDGRILPGVSRAAVLRAAASLGMNIHERSLPLSELLTADEFLASNSLRGLMMVRRCLDREWSSESPIAAKLVAETNGWEVDGAEFRSMCGAARI